MNQVPRICVTGIVANQNIPDVLGIAMPLCKDFPPLFVPGNHKGNCLTEDFHEMAGQYVSLCGHLSKKLPNLKHLITDMRVDGGLYES